MDDLTPRHSRRSAFPYSLLFTPFLILRPRHALPISVYICLTSTSYQSPSTRLPIPDPWLCPLTALHTPNLALLVSLIITHVIVLKISITSISSCRLHSTSQDIFIYLILLRQANGYYQSTYINIKSVVVFPPLTIGRSVANCLTSRSPSKKPEDSAHTVACFGLID